MTDPDVSGMLRMLTDELQDAEDAGDRGEYPVLDRSLLMMMLDPSLDYRTCTVWMGWFKPLAESNKSLLSNVSLFHSLFTAKRLISAFQS
jgi:hypothetical protein